MPDDTQIALARALTRSRSILLPPLAAAMLLGSVDTLLTFRAIPAATAMGAIVYYVPLLAVAGPVLEIPVSLLVRRVGARRFIAAALLLAGLAAAGTAISASPVQFFALRLVGFVAQTVVVPAAAFLAATWAPARSRTGMLSWLAATITLAPVLSALLWSVATPVISAPLAFAATGAAWIAAAAWCWFALADTPGAAKWLDEPQRAAMHWASSIERRERRRPGLIDLRLLILVGVTFGLAISAAAAAQWVGLLLRDVQTPRGWFDLILAVIAALAVLAWAQAADKSGRVAGALALACGLAAIGFAAAVLKGPMWLKTAGLVAHGASVAAARCMTWSLAGRLSHGDGRGALGFATIDAAGRAGMLAGPLIVIWFARAFENLQYGMFAVLALMAAAILAAAALKLVSTWE